MTPEEQNVVQAQTKFDSFMSRKVSAYKKQKQKIDENYSNQSAAKMDNDTMTLYKSGLEATDKKTKGQYNVASRANLLAELVTNAAKDKGIELTGNATDRVGAYLEGFPDAYQPFMEFTHSDQDPEEFAVQMGWMEAPEKNSNTFTNVLGGLTESALGIPKFLAKGAANVAGWSIKALGGDEERANAAVDKVKGAIDNFGFGDEDSAAYQVSNVAGDIGQLLIPGVNAAKGVQLLSKTPKIAKYLSETPKLAKWLEKAEATAEKYPKIAKMLKWGEQGAEDMIKYNAINQEGTSFEDLTSGALLNIAFGGAGKLVGKATDTLGIKGLMTTPKAKEVIAAIQKEGGGAKTIDDMAEWFNKRPFQGSKDEVATQLKQWATDAGELKDELLSSINKKYKSSEVTDILNELKKSYEGVKGQEENLAKIETLIRKDNLYTPSEMEQARKYLQDSSLNPFRKKGVGEVVDTVKDEGMANLYRQVKTQIENIATKEGVGNIKALNNEIMVANKMREGITQKGLSDAIKDGLKGYTIPSAIAGYLVEGDLEGALKWWAGVRGAKLLMNTGVRTYLSRSIQKLKGTEKVELTKWMNSGGTETLSDKVNKELAKILENSDGEVRDEIERTFIDYIKETSRVGGVVGGANAIESAIGE